jgi:hypothetical protein
MAASPAIASVLELTVRSLESKQNVDVEAKMRSLSRNIVIANGIETRLHQPRRRGLLSHRGLCLIASP